MMKSAQRLALAVGLLSAGAAAGCISVGGPFSSERVARLVIGRSTKDDVTKAFGQPFRTGTADGDETWTFVDYRFRVFGAQQAKDLYVRFNKDGTVKSYTFNSTD